LSGERPGAAPARERQPRADLRRPRADSRHRRGGVPTVVSVTPLNSTLDQELLALERGVSMECPVCGEFLLRSALGLRCSECGSTLARGAVGMGTQLQFSLQAG